LPGFAVANVSSFGYLAGNTTSERFETATAHTGERCKQVCQHPAQILAFVNN